MKNISNWLNSCRFLFFTAILAAGSTDLFAATWPTNGKTVGSSSSTSNTTNLNDFKPTAPQKDYALSWSTSLKADHSLDELSNNKNEIELGLTLKFDLAFSPWMSMNLTPKIIAQNGYIQAPDSVDPAGSRIEIRNASLDLKPSNLFNFSVGSLDQRIYHEAIFMSRRSFPAARLVSRIGDEKKNHLYVFLESAMPTSSSISNNNADLGATPSLNSAGLGFQLGADSVGYTIKSFVNAYQFAGLSRDLSTSSVFLGNSGVNSAGSNYLFKYDYQGFEASFEGKFHLTRPLALGFFADGIENTQAPTGKNLGWNLGGFVKYDFSRSFQVEPRFNYYHMESDATVAVYNDSFINTNREGYVSQVKFYYNQKVQLKISYGQRVPIVLNPSQPSETWYGLGLETENANF